MNYLLDSSAWIEYLEGSKAGETVNKIIENSENIFILSINIAEVISKLSRKSKNFNLAYESMIKNSKIVEITPRIAKNAGLLHATIKPKNKSFSLADALIIETAKSLDAKIVIKDNHFKHFKNTILI